MQAVNICALLLLDAMHDEIQHGKDIVDKFLEACPNVCSLRITEEDGVWASEMQMRSNKLQLQCIAIVQYNCIFRPVTLLQLLLEDLKQLIQHFQSSYGFQVLGRTYL